MTKIPSVEERVANFEKAFWKISGKSAPDLQRKQDAYITQTLTAEREAGAKAENERCAVSAWSTGMKVGTDLMEGRELGARCAKEIRDNLTQQITPMTKIPSVEERVDNIDQIRSENTFTTTVFLEVRREDLIKALTAEREAGAREESERVFQVIGNNCNDNSTVHDVIKALTPPTK